MANQAAIPGVSGEQLPKVRWSRNNGLEVRCSSNLGSQHGWMFGPVQASAGGNGAAAPVPVRAMEYCDPAAAHLARGEVSRS